MRKTPDYFDAYTTLETGVRIALASLESGDTEKARQELKVSLIYSSMLFEEALEADCSTAMAGFDIDQFLDEHMPSKEK